MRALKLPAQIERPRRISNRVKLARNTAGLMLALAGLTYVCALPGYCWNQPLSFQSTIEPAKKEKWSFTGDLNTPRTGHTATLLSNGKVLVAGGDSFNSAELYDPVTGTWSFTGSLNVPRGGHTATLLKDGKVLVAAGGGDNTAELYDPATGTWSLTGNLNVGRYLHTATLLENGEVLIAGGGDTLNYFAMNAAEVYDPTTGTWSLTGNLNDGRLGHTATLLANGKVLVAGGSPNVEYDGGLSSAELYDPATETWSPTSSLNTWRVDYAAVLLPDGDVLVAGGDWLFPSPGASEIYNVATGRWSPNAGTGLRYRHTLTLLENGKALTAGGAIFGISVGVGFAGTTLSDAEIYNPATGSWKRTAKLNEPRANHTATLLADGKVLVVGGFKKWCCSDYLRSAELYDPEIFDPTPRIISASVAGKKLFVAGENFDDGAAILINGEKEKTMNDNQNPQTMLVGKKAGKKIRAGDRIQVRNPDGTASEEFVFSGS